MKFFFIIFTITVFYSSILAIQVETDTIESKLEDSIEARIDGYLSIAFDSIEANSEYAFSLCQKSLFLAKKINNAALIAESYYSYGDVNYSINRFSESLENYRKSIELYFELEDTFNIIHAYNSIGWNYYSMAMFDSAISSYSKAEYFAKKGRYEKLQMVQYSDLGNVYSEINDFKKAIIYYDSAFYLANEIGDTLSLMNTYNYKGLIYNDLGIYEKAINNYSLALQILKNTDYTNNRSMVLNNIGIVYHNLKDFDAALKYYTQSYNIDKVNNSKSGMAGGLNNIGIIYSEIGQFDSSLIYYKRAEELEKKYGSKSGLSMVYNNMGEVYFDLGYFDKSMKYLYQSLKMDFELKDKSGIANSYNSIGNIYYRHGVTDSAEINLQKSLSLSRELGLKDLIAENYKIFFELYKSNKEYEKALGFYEKYIELKTEIENDIVKNQLDELNLQLTLEKRQKEIEKLNLEKEYQELQLKEKQEKIKQQKNIQFILIGGVSIIFIFSIVLFIQIRKKRKANNLLRKRNVEIRRNREEIIIAKEKAEESDKLKTAFLATISHELRTPLNGILGFAELLMVELKDQDNISSARYIYTSGQILLDQIESMFEMSLLENSQIELSLNEFYLSTFLEELNSVVDNERKVLNKEQIQVKFSKKNVVAGIELFNDENLIKNICRRLLSNSIKFTERGFVEIGVDEINKETVTFYVKDTGIGIEKSKQDLIFEKFRQIDDSFSRAYEGIGLGLAIAKEYSKLIQGSLWFTSEKNKGTIFYLSFPRIYKSEKN